MKMEAIHKGAEFLKTCIVAIDSSIEVEIMPPANPLSDGLVKINGHLILIESKSEIYPQNVIDIESQLRSNSNNKHLMVIANYITPKAKQALKERSLNYIDGAGNIYLKLPNLLLQIEGNKNPSTATRHRNRAFTKSGGAVVFQFLMDPELVNAPQRTIAQYANVSLGTIPKVLEGLRNEGFLVQIDEKNRQLINYEKLLDKWEKTLNDKILPTQFIQNYMPINASPQELLKKGTIGADTQWGGEAAASLLTKYLIPEQFTLFTSNKTELITKHKLVPFQEGRIKVYHKFWSHSDCQNAHVHPVLIYAQLIASGDSRNLETAEIIKNEYLRSNI